MALAALAGVQIAFADPIIPSGGYDRAAIQALIDAAQSGDTIELGAGIFKLDSQLTVNKAITIQGQGWDTTIIQGKESNLEFKQENPNTRCITLNGGAVLKNVTLTGGTSYKAGGGGALVLNGTISWCCISNNVTSSGNNYGGGAVSFTSGHGQIDHCIIVGNTLKAGWGGGIGAVGLNGDVLIDTCLIYGNTVNGSSSGGIGFDTINNATVTVRNCTITGNTATTAGGNCGGLYVDNGSGSTVILVNNIITGNLSGTVENNTKVKTSFLDLTRSSNCLITGSNTDANNCYRDQSLKALVPNVVTEAPAFQDAAGFDFHLTGDSPARNAGVTYAGIGVDLDNIAFALNPSLGCYEVPGVVPAAKPTITPASTTFYPSIDVTLACATENSTIYYTTDGSEPANTNGTAYAGETITFNATTTIKAIAYAPDYGESRVATATFTCTEPAQPVFGTISVHPTARTATISGTISSVGNLDASACDVYLAYGADAQSLGEYVKIASAVANGGSFSSIVSGLDAETSYAYSFVASNNATYVTSASTAGSFTTTAVAGTLTPVAGNAAATWQRIQDAIDDAALASPAGTVTLGAGTFDINTQLQVHGGVTLVGQGWGSTTIRQTAAISETSRVVYVDNGSVVSNMSITGGKVKKAGGWAHGGGAFIKDGTVSWCRVYGNLCGDINAANNFGGGIAFGGGKGQVDHSIVEDNEVIGLQTSYGGGISIRDLSGAIVIDSCLIRGNTVVYKNGSGAAAGFYGDFSSNTGKQQDMIVRNTTIVGNVAGDKGKLTAAAAGAVYTVNDPNGKFRMYNCILAGNETLGAGTTVSFAYSAGVDYCLFDIAEDKVGDNSIVGDAGFIGAESAFFKLGSSSPAVHAGTARPAADDVDLAGVAYDAVPSMGCYEYVATVADPVFSADPAVTFYPTLEVSLTCATEDAVIRYTLDGSEPTEMSDEYTAPVTLVKTTKIRARAFKADVPASAIVSATFMCAKPVSGFAKCVEITLEDALASEPRSGVPALVKLGTGIVGFDYADFKLPNGGDMMFLTKDGYPLAHEVDTWDTTGESYVWVRMPSTAVGTKIVMYYGNGATPTEEPANVWSDYSGVWHLNAVTPTTVPNSLGTYANSTAAEGIDANLSYRSTPNQPGKIGRSFMVNDSVTIGAQGHPNDEFNNGGVWVNDPGTDSPIDGGEHFTISGWFKHKEYGYFYDHYFYKREKADNSGTKRNAFAIEANSSSGDNPQIIARGSSNVGSRGLNGTVVAERWEYFTFVYDGAKVSIYRNGVPESEGARDITACVDNDLPLVFGNNCNIADGVIGDAAYGGWIDEVRLSKYSMTARAIAAEYAAMNADSGCDIFSYGAVQDIKPLRNGLLIYLR